MSYQCELCEETHPSGAPCDGTMFSPREVAALAYLMWAPHGQPTFDLLVRQHIMGCLVLTEHQAEQLLRKLGWKNRHTPPKGKRCRAAICECRDRCECEWCKQKRSAR